MFLVVENSCCHPGLPVVIFGSERALGCLLMLRILLLVSYCVLMWVFFSVLGIFCVTSFGDRNLRNTNKLPKFLEPSETKIGGSPCILQSIKAIQESYDNKLLMARSA